MEEFKKTRSRFKINICVGGSLLINTWSISIYITTQCKNEKINKRQLYIWYTRGLVVQSVLILLESIHCFRFDCVLGKDGCFYFYLQFCILIYIYIYIYFIVNITK